MNSRVINLVGSTNLGDLGLSGQPGQLSTSPNANAKQRLRRNRLRRHKKD